MAALLFIIWPWVSARNTKGQQDFRLDMGWQNVNLTVPWSTVKVNKSIRVSEKFSQKSIRFSNNDVVFYQYSQGQNISVIWMF